jgi:hypothetical protein
MSDEMITKQLLKDEIDYVQDAYLEALYKIIKAFRLPVDEEHAMPHTEKQLLDTSDAREWHAFIQETYGCLADDPIARGEQGTFETRKVLQ